MTADRRAALLQKVAEAMWLADIEPYDPADRIPFEEAPEGVRAYCLAEASAALDLALEEAAKVASDYQHPNMALFNHQTGIAAAISALKSKP